MAGNLASVSALCVARATHLEAGISYKGIDVTLWNLTYVAILNAQQCDYTVTFCC